MLSVGAINGRNIWKTDLNAALDWLEPLHASLGDRLWIAPSCSLLHVPVDLNSEQKLDAEIKSWLAFALQKLDELTVLAGALNHGRASVADALAANAAAIESRRNSLARSQPGGQGGHREDRRGARQTRERLCATRRRSNRLSSACRLSRPRPSARFRKPARFVTHAASSRAASWMQAGYKSAMRARDHARREGTGSVGARRARARRSRTQRHGRILRRTTRRLRIQPVRLGAVLRLALREAADPVRRYQPPEGDDRRMDQVRAVADRRSR